MHMYACTHTHTTPSLTSPMPSPFGHLYNTHTHHSQSCQPHASWVTFISASSLLTTIAMSSANHSPSSPVLWLTALSGHRDEWKPPTDTENIEYGARLQATASGQATDLFSVLLIQTECLGIWASRQPSSWGHWCLLSLEQTQGCPRTGMTL